MSKEPQAIVALLDQQYEQLLVDARRLVASYVDASMKLYKKTGARSVVAAVSIKQTSPNAYSIYWCKLVPLHVRIPRHLDTQPTLIWTLVPRPLGQAVGAQRRRVALLV